MQIQPQNNINFNGKGHITSPQKLAGMISHLESKGLSYKLDGDNLYWGKDLTKLVKELASPNSDVIELNNKSGFGKKKKQLDLVKYELGVIKTIKDWQKEKAFENAMMQKLMNIKKNKLDDIQHGKKI